MKLWEDELLELGARVETALGDLCEEARKLFSTLEGDEIVVSLSEAHCKALTAFAALIGSPKTFLPSPERQWADKHLGDLEQQQ